MQKVSFRNKSTMLQFPMVAKLMRMADVKRRLGVR